MDLFNHVIVNEQQGFRRAIKILTNLYLVETVTMGRQVDAIYTDLQEAFDKVDPGLLLAKLYKLGLRYPLFSWFFTCLNERSQLVKIGSSVSKYRECSKNYLYSSFFNSNASSGTSFSVLKCVKNYLQSFLIHEKNVKFVDIVHWIGFGEKHEGERTDSSIYHDKIQKRRYLNSELFFFNY